MKSGSRKTKRDTSGWKTRRGGALVPMPLKGGAMRPFPASYVPVTYPRLASGIDASARKETCDAGVGVASADILTGSLFTLTFTPEAVE